MILLDTSVIVGYLRRPSDAVRAIFLEHEAAICGVTLAELLFGAKNPTDLDRLVAAIQGFRRLEIAEGVWTSLGYTLFQLRTQGIVVPFQDVLLATVAMYHRVALWSYDAHFPMIQSALPMLKLFEEPIQHPL